MLLSSYADITTGQTSFYASYVENTLLSRVAGWSLSQPNATSDAATLAGLEEAFLVMTDDKSVAYGGARIVVGQFSQSTSTRVHINVIRFGTPAYTYLVFVMNALVVQPSAEAHELGNGRNLPLSITLTNES